MKPFDPFPKLTSEQFIEKAPRPMDAMTDLLLLVSIKSPRRSVRVILRNGTVYNGCIGLTSGGCFVLEYTPLHSTPRRAVFEGASVMSIELSKD